MDKHWQYRQQYRLYVEKSQHRLCNLAEQHRHRNPACLRQLVGWINIGNIDDNTDCM